MHKSIPPNDDKADIYTPKPDIMPAEFIIQAFGDSDMTVAMWVI